MNLRWVWTLIKYWKLENLISQLKGKHTIILSTHILSEVQASCDRVIIIKEGKMVTQDSLSSLRSKQQQSRHRISVRVQNISDQLIDELKMLKNIEDVNISQNSMLVLSVLAGSEGNLNEEVAKKIIEMGAGFLELNESFSLEDVFLKLTADDQTKEKE